MTVHKEISKIRSIKTGNKRLKVKYRKLNIVSVP